MTTAKNRTEVYPIDTRNATRTTGISKMHREGVGIGTDNGPAPTLTRMFTPAVAQCDEGNDVAATITKHYHKGFTTTPEDGELVIHPVECYDPAHAKQVDVASTITGDHENRVTDTCTLIGFDPDVVKMTDVTQTIAGDHNNRVTIGGTLVANGIHSLVRRLTPMECERLQGIPDGYTLIPFYIFRPTKKARKMKFKPPFPTDFYQRYSIENLPEIVVLDDDMGAWKLKWREIDQAEADFIISHFPHLAHCVRKDKKGRIKTCLVSDGPRYMTCGNGWPRNCPRWILQRMDDYIQIHEGEDE